MDGELKGTVSLSPQQTKREQARYQAMRDNLRRRKEYKKAVEVIRFHQISSLEDTENSVFKEKFGNVEEQAIKSYTNISIDANSLMSSAQPSAETELTKLPVEEL